MDYGFHAPTMSFPIPNTLMIEPTESENIAELNRFVEAMISIKKEADDIAQKKISLEESPLRGAPHPLVDAHRLEGNLFWPNKRCFPLPWLKEHKFWPSSARIDNAYGDRELVCSCEPVDSYSKSLPSSSQASSQEQQR